MQDVEGVNRSKEKILSILRLKGPCLPVQIAREINFSPLFTSAFLSELKDNGKVKISNMRVGSSPLYYIPGQETMLEKFSGYLNQREKEAFFHLKENSVLNDRDQTPVMRVALRAIKDFAVPINLNVDGETKIFWKHFSLTDEDVLNLIDNKKKPRKEPEKIVDKVEKEVINEVVEEVVQKVEAKPREVEKNLEVEARPIAEKKQKKAQESEFGINVKDYLASKEIEVLEVYLEKKKEFEAKVRIDTLFGKQEYYLVAKDKKSVSDNDFTFAWQKAHEKKMIAAVMATGDLNKKGKEHLENWGNLVKYEKLRF